MPRILVNGIEQVDVVIDYSKTIDWSEYCIRIHLNFTFKQYQIFGLISLSII